MFVQIYMIIDDPWKNFMVDYNHGVLVIIFFKRILSPENCQIMHTMGLSLICSKNVLKPLDLKTTTPL